MPKRVQESSLLRAGLELQSERTPVDNRPRLWAPPAVRDYAAWRR